MQEVIWSVIKSGLGCQPQLLTNRHLDQIIMCSIYSVIKMGGGIKLDFNTIIKTYTSLFIDKENTSLVWSKCKINDKGDTKDIISFYNEVFLPIMQPCILAYKGQAK